MRIDYLLLALLWVAYCAVHSILISIRVTSFFKCLLGVHYRYYRLFFNLFSLITLILLISYSRIPRYQGPVLWNWSGVWRIVQVVLFVAACALLIGGARHYNMRQFLGIQQICNRRSSAGLTESGDLDTSGVLGITRHPWYVGVFLLLWVSEQNAASILINTILSAYLVIGTLLEERKLVREFGDRYRQYQATVSMFVPLRRSRPEPK